jgi:DNA-binding transcriptional LysR family regulator
MIPAWNSTKTGRQLFAGGADMRDLDLTTLRFFVAVCEARSIARAAEQASIVGSAISKRMALLEATVGLPLLVRKRRGVEPTSAGETLLEHARVMLASAARIERDMAAYASGIRGQVRVLASTSAMAESLADDVASFLKSPEHRDIRIDLEERHSSEVVRGVQQGSAALGVCWASLDGADLGALQSQPYRTDRLALAVHPSHPLARARSVRFVQALDHEHVCLPVTSAVQLMLQRQAAAMGRALVHRVIVSSFEAALRVVQANLAISIVPHKVAQRYAETQAICTVDLDEPWAERRFAICFRDEAALSPAARLLMVHLRVPNELGMG